ncbi:MAG: hypothetical protein JWM34_2783 [Ilumatobacteraceae bacterium]|nr:hypothetical protein [Ilumatobacteraceae bacterium]
MQTRHLIASSIAGLATIALVGCSSSSNSSGATIPANAGLVVYAGPGIKFDKTSYTATAGAAVVVAYDNRDAQRHTLDIVNSSKTVVGGELNVGKSGDIATGTYDLPAGTYTLECLVPGHDAMRATLVVK